MLSDVLFQSGPANFDTIIPLNSNVEAVEAGLHFCAGRSDNLLIAGPSGWGKTRILTVMSVRHQIAQPRMLSASEFFACPDLGDIPEPLLLDDVQEVWARPRYRMALRLVLERRMRCRRQTALVFTVPGMSRALKQLVPNSRDWTFAEIADAPVEDRVRLIQFLGRRTGLRLSETLVSLLASEMGGNGRTFAGALNRLKACGPDWTDSAQILKACGILDPFFQDNPEWDLAHRILSLAHRRGPDLGLDPLPTALFTMLHIAGLGESHVARVTNVAPGGCYQRANAFAAEVRQDPRLTHRVASFVDVVVKSLVR